MTDNAELISLTADIVSSMVANNEVANDELPGLISSVHAALANTAAPAKPDVPAEQVGATTIRKSLASPDHIVSMIDGKPYKALKRHITRHGFTVASYKEAFGLPASYPTVAKGYSATRRELSLKLGLGRKKLGGAAEAVEVAADTVVKPVKTATKKLGIVIAKAGAAVHLGGLEGTPKKRGRPPKAKTS